MRAEEVITPPPEVASQMEDVQAECQVEQREMDPPLRWTEWTHREHMLLPQQIIEGLCSSSGNGCNGCTGFFCPPGTRRMSLLPFVFFATCLCLRTRQRTAKPVLVWWGRSNAKSHLPVFSSPMARTLGCLCLQSQNACGTRRSVCMCPLTYKKLSLTP